jgi:hypothetical protein
VEPIKIKARIARIVGVGMTIQQVKGHGGNGIYNRNAKGEPANRPDSAAIIREQEEKQH